jgi:hypothetical protein
MARVKPSLNVLSQKKMLLKSTEYHENDVTVSRTFSPVIVAIRLSNEDCYVWNEASITEISF